MSRGKTLTEKDFKIIKTLLSNGLTIKQVVTVTNWKDTAVRYVQQADDYEQYKENNRIRLNKYDKNKLPLIEPIEGSKSSFSITPISITPTITPSLPSNDEKFIVTLAGLTQAINRLSDVLEQDTPLEKQAREFKLFGRK